MSAQKTAEIDAKPLAGEDARIERTRARLAEAVLSLAALR